MDKSIVTKDYDTGLDSELYSAVCNGDIIDG
jgi:hypothetical protein